MRSVPAPKTHPWWRLWFSGAFDRETVFRRVLADRLEAAYEPGGYVFGDALEYALCIRERVPVKGFRALWDMAAFVSQDLRLTMPQYERITAAIFGRSAAGLDEEFRRNVNAG